MWSSNVHNPVCGGPRSFPQIPQQQHRQQPQEIFQSQLISQPQQQISFARQQSQADKQQETDVLNISHLTSTPTQCQGSDTSFASGLKWFESMIRGFSEQQCASLKSTWPTVMGSIVLLVFHMMKTLLACFRPADQFIELHHTHLCFSQQSCMLSGVKQDSALMSGSLGSNSSKSH